MTVPSSSCDPRADTAEPGVSDAEVILVSGRSELRVAGLTVLDRLLVALHRAGCRSIVVVGSLPLPPTARARALGVRFEGVPNPRQSDRPTLEVRAEILVHVADLRRLLAAAPGTRLTGTSGEPLPMEVVACSGNTSATESGSEEPALLAAEGVAVWVRDETEARDATRVLWRSLASSADGWVDRVFNRPVGRPLARWLSGTWVTPNQISVVSILLGVAAAACLAVGQYAWAVFGAIMFQLSAVLDCVDGDVARVVFKESPMGKWLDLVGDQVVHVSVFAGIAVGLARGGTSAPVGWLGACAIAGALLSFAMVLRGMRRARIGRRGDLQRLLDAATNRDFSVLVLGLAWGDWLEAFLWLAAIGSHVFWLLLWWLQGRESAEEGKANS